MNTKVSIITILCLIMVSISCSSLKYGNYMESPYQIVESNEYGTKGVIFPDTVSFPQPGFRKPGNFDKRYTPNSEEIFEFETIFHDQFEDFIKTKDYYDPKFNEGIGAESYQEYIRQYFGYYDGIRQRYLMVIVSKLDTRNDRENWYKGPTLKTTGNFILFINLESGMLYDRSDIGYMPIENPDK